MLKTLCFGEVIFNEVENDLHFGGPAVNVAVHLSRLGNSSYIITALGNDKSGRKASDFLKSENVHINYIRENSSKPTMQTLQWDLLYIATGSLRSPENRTLLNHILRKANFKQIFFDINLRQQLYSSEFLQMSLQDMKILKINSDDLLRISTLLFGEILDGKSFFQKTFEEYNIEVMIIICASEGAIVFSNELANGFILVNSRILKNIGADDLFSAVLINSYLNGESIGNAAKRAARFTKIASRNDFYQI